MSWEPWEPFTGDYDKRFYEVLIMAGHVVRHVWPNAGRLYHTDGNAQAYGPEHKVKFRPCTCGHKFGGCAKPEAPCE